MLETTLKTEFVPGTNLTGGLACASWRFLLPSLQIESILCLEVPAIATLNVLSQHGKNLTVISTNASKLEAARQKLERQGASQLRMIHVRDFKRLPLEDKSVDLILLAGENGLAFVRRSPTLHDEFNRLLTKEGTVYFEIATLGQRLGSRRVLQRLRDDGFKRARLFWLTPLRGELRTAFPLGDEQMTQYLLSHVLFGQSLKKRTASRFGKLLSQSGVFSRLMPRRAVLLQRSQRKEQVCHAPQYLVDLAKPAGLDLRQYRCGLSARGKYNSNKTIFYAFEKNSTKADVVVKMTRAPEFNARLENEYRVLALLDQHGHVARETFPRPLFFGQHAGLVVVGQKAVHGEPFRSRTQGTVHCPLAQQALAWMTQLAASSAQPSSGREVAEALAQLFERFRGIYALSNPESAFLAEQIKLIAQSASAFPLVFQHGDPGTWNMLVSPEGKLIVIDWEAGEAQGLPLWDLFYFMRSFGNWCVRRSGVRDTLKGFAQNFIAPSEVGALLIETVERYCARIGLERRLVGPLFYTCWMHRALKEATRLSGKELERGHYFNLLKLAMAEHEAPGLQALLG
ncbi:phosphotransferase [candidate division KSB1 bacterium]|nr:phosphotransferase [candidate division KSB1 bacterium]